MRAWRFWQCLVQFCAKRLRIHAMSLKGLPGKDQGPEGRRMWARGQVCCKWERMSKVKTGTEAPLKKKNSHNSFKGKLLKLLPRKAAARRHLRGGWAMRKLSWGKSAEFLSDSPSDDSPHWSGSSKPQTVLIQLNWAFHTQIDSQLTTRQPQPYFRSSGIRSS